MRMDRRTALSAAAAGGLALLANAAIAQERHPRIRAAINALEQAKDYMQHAAHDFGGHRVEALAACDRAIEQLRIALQFDRK